MGFWIKLTVAPARVALGITTFLAVKVRASFNTVVDFHKALIKTLGQTFSRGMPKVSYVKMIDIWMIGPEFISNGPYTLSCMVIGEHFIMTRYCDDSR